MKIDSEKLERMMQIVNDLKKVIVYSKSEGVWYWHDKDDQLSNSQCSFDTFLTCVEEICEPYLNQNE